MFNLWILDLHQISAPNLNKPVNFEFVLGWVLFGYYSLTYIVDSLSDPVVVLA